MKKFIRKAAKKRGLPPGSLVHVGKQRETKVSNHLISYKEGVLQEKDNADINELFPLPPHHFNWMNLDGVHDIQKIEDIKKNLQIPDLVLEDVVNTNQRAKVEEFESCLFVVLKMIRLDDKGKQAIHEQTSFVLGQDFLLSFQDEPGDTFDFVRDRLRRSSRKIRSRGSDYLLFALIDTIVDNYLIVLERFGERIEDLEQKILSNKGDDLTKSISRLRNEVNFLRKQISPIREITYRLQKGALSLIKEENSEFFRDVYDHSLDVIETLDSYKDTLGTITDLYFSLLSHRMNEIMKFLTIYASIFIPLTFVAGIYGMNFQSMPELHWSFGYPLALGVMAAITLFMIRHFKKKNWL